MPIEFVNSWHNRTRHTCLSNSCFRGITVHDTHALLIRAFVASTYTTHMPISFVHSWQNRTRHTCLSHSCNLGISVHDTHAYLIHAFGAI